MGTHTLHTHVDIYIADTEIRVSESNADSLLLVTEEG